MILFINGLQWKGYKTPKSSALKRPVDALEAAANKSAGFFVRMDVEFAFLHRIDNFFRCDLR
jgi:hypothetical protein